MKNKLHSSIFDNIDNYHDDMIISQIIRFFERKNIFFTKMMIQHYIKLGLLPPPLKKRYYSKGHLFLLSLIYYLKPFYALEDLKHILEKFAGICEDPKLIAQLYNHYVDTYTDYIEELDPYTTGLLEASVDNTSPQQNIEYDEQYFTAILKLMAQMHAQKDIVTNIVKNPHSL